MNEANQKRNIQSFTSRRLNKDVDAFCIYQWIERCHYRGWWDLGIALGSCIPPNSFNTHYNKRLDFLLKECRNQLSASPDPTPLPAERPTRYIVGTPRPAKHIPQTTLPMTPRFDNSRVKTLQQIYFVLYHMWHGQDFHLAVRSCMRALNVKDYQTVCDKCARRFAGTVDDFKRWYFNGEILHRLKDKFHLSYHDAKIFEDLLSKDRF